MTPIGTPDLSVTVAGIELKNPIIAASGTFGYGIEFDGRGWLMPLADCDALLFIVLVIGAGIAWFGVARRSRRPSSAGERLLRRAPGAEPPHGRRPLEARRARVGLADEHDGVCDPRSIRLAAAGVAWTTCQPVTTMSLSGSPGRSSVRRGSPITAREASVARNGAPAPPRPASGDTQKSATSALPAGRGPAACRTAMRSPPG